MYTKLKLEEEKERQRWPKLYTQWSSRLVAFHGILWHSAAILRVLSQSAPLCQNLLDLDLDLGSRGSAEGAS